jgi:hypothetical protein
MKAMAESDNLVFPNCRIPGFLDGCVTVLLPVENVVPLHPVYALQTQTMRENIERGSNVDSWLAETATH